MFRMLQMRLVGTVWGVATVAALSGLPPEHLHAAGTLESSRPVVHRHHVDSHSPGSSSSLEHGDHATAVLLSSAFDTIQKFAVGPPVVVPFAVVISPPVAAPRPSGSLRRSPDTRTSEVLSPLPRPTCLAVRPPRT